MDDAATVIKEAITGLIDELSSEQQLDLYVELLSLTCHRKSGKLVYMSNYEFQGYRSWKEWLCARGVTPDIDYEKVLRDLTFLNNLKQMEEETKK